MSDKEYIKFLEEEIKKLSDIVIDQTIAMKKIGVEKQDIYVIAFLPTIPKYYTNTTHGFYS